MLKKEKEHIKKEMRIKKNVSAPWQPQLAVPSESSDSAANNAITLTDKIFQSANGKSLEEAKPYTLHYGEIKDKDGNTIDDVLVSVFVHPTVIQARTPPRFPVTAADTFFSRFSIALRR